MRGASPRDGSRNQVAAAPIAVTANRGCTRGAGEFIRQADRRSQPGERRRTRADKPRARRNLIPACTRCPFPTAGCCRQPSSWRVLSMPPRRVPVRVAIPLPTRAAFHRPGLPLSVVAEATGAALPHLCCRDTVYEVPNGVPPVPLMRYAGQRADFIRETYLPDHESLPWVLPAESLRPQTPGRTEGDGCRDRWRDCLPSHWL